MSRWPRTVVLGALVAAIGAVHARGAGERIASGRQLLARTAEAMARAGFAVSMRREGWPGGAIAGPLVLVARHRDCAAAVELRETNAFNPRGGADTLYRYGGIEGANPGPLAIIAEAAAMEWRHARAESRDASPSPTIHMLAITDPSACLAITATDWRGVWFGPAGAMPTPAYQGPH